MSDRYTIGDNPFLSIGNCDGDLEIRVGEAHTIEIESNQHSQAIEFNGKWHIERLSGQSIVTVPSNTILDIQHVERNLTVQGITRVHVQRVGGDIEFADISDLARIEHGGGDYEASRCYNLEIAQIGGDVDINDAVNVAISNVPGDLNVHTIRNALAVDNISGDAEINECENAKIAFNNVHGDLDIDNAETISVERVAGDVSGKAIHKALSISKVDGDVHLRNSNEAQFSFRHISGDLDIEGAYSINAEHIAGDLAIANIAQQVSVKTIEGDCFANLDTARLTIGHISGEASLNINGALQLGRVSGDLKLNSPFSNPASHNAIVSGDAIIQVGENANLLIQALVRGDFRGGKHNKVGNQNYILHYGEGANTFNLIVDGDATINGNSGFGEEMRNLGQELGELGRTLSRELSQIFDSTKNTVSKQAEETLRQAKESLRQAERATKQAVNTSADNIPYVQVRVNEQSWAIDNEQIERIKQQANTAAQSGIQGAIEAVERALSGLRQNHEQDMQAPNSAVTGATTKLDPQTEAEIQQHKEQVEQDRTVILQMIAEGRISPEEGDMLLDAL